MVFEGQTGSTFNEDDGMNITAIRGILLEELVLHLLELVGYRIVLPGEEGTRSGRSGLEVQGRSEWYLIDALAALDRTPAFMYPLRLIVEAKCYDASRPVQITVPRNSVGVLKDISENFFTYSANSVRQSDVQVPRFNYHSSIFSTSGYTAGAQRYALAHQIFLIQYKRVAALQPVIAGLMALRAPHILRTVFGSRDKKFSASVRHVMRELLGRQNSELPSWDNDVFTSSGMAHVIHEIIEPLSKIRGSCFGMLQGKWPMHLVSRSPLPTAAFAASDEILCRVYGYESDRWSFSPSQFKEGDPEWFRLEFDIPEEILGFVQSARGDPRALATMKGEQMSLLTVAGRIGELFRQVQLRLDREWLALYLERVRTRTN